MEHSESYWEHSWEQNEALKAGYGLDRFVHDSLYVTRAEVAKQGYGLDLLSNDPHAYVQKAVSEYLTQHETTLEDWIRDNPDKCAYPIMKKQMQDAGLRVGEITLLTTDEAKKYASVIPKVEKAFWVQPGSRPVYSDHHAFTVGPRYLDRADSLDVERGLAEVHPALRMKTSRYPKLHKGDKLALLGNEWTVLDVSPKEVLLFSDKSFDSRKFGKAGPYYETSDVKQYLDGWLDWKLGKGEHGAVAVQDNAAGFQGNRHQLAHHAEMDFLILMNNAFNRLPETVDKRKITAEEFFTHVCENKGFEALREFLDSHDITSKDDEFAENFWHAQNGWAMAHYNQSPDRPKHFEEKEKPTNGLDSRIARARAESEARNALSKESGGSREQKDFQI